MRWSHFNYKIFISQDKLFRNDLAATAQSRKRADVYLTIQEKKIRENQKKI